MSNRPVLEEIDDDDIDMDMDISKFDPSLRTPIGGGNQARMTPPAKLERKEGKDKIVDPNKLTADELSHLKLFQIIYPCYFDKNRSHKQGRRVSERKAVNNPLAKTIVDACHHLFLHCMLELDKTHPQDYGNPGRVRVWLKEDGNPQDQRFKTKRELLNIIADYLISHPTTLEMVGPKSGMPVPREFETADYEPLEVPKVKGYRMNTIVPAHLTLTVKHPMTKSIYDPEPEPLPTPKNPAKQMKKKVMKIRG